MSSTVCQAGGSRMRIAWTTSMPPARSTSSMLSRLDESEPVSETIGFSSLMSSSFSERKFFARASAQLRFPWIVLISPLWARNRKGWASRHCGSVLVEKRWWNTHTDDSSRGSLRSR